ncbi:hypothetical protein GOBAR_DD23134 [Gossypium barbadense]|nr:hypothetical protein GOBAR_DD23134 [Gossypium barbadense]
MPALRKSLKSVGAERKRSNVAFARRINEPLNRSWEVRPCHVYREANAAEDLAVPTILQQDLAGTASLRCNFFV